MINGFLKTIASLLMLCTVVSFASCRNDGDDEELGGGTTGQPPVITFDNGTGIYTVKIMKSITITPLVNDATDPVYTWKDEKGKIVCTDLSYTYSPKAEGEVYFKFRVDAKNGYAEEELRVDVVEKMIPSVSLIPAYSTYMGKSVTLESSVNFTEGAKYEWVSIDESGKTKETVGTEATYTFTPTEEGQFSFKLTVTNEDGSGNASTSVLVSPEPVMNITFSSNQLTVPKGRAACIAPVITDTTTHATYVWEIDEVMQQGETGPTFTFTPPTTGSYVVKVTGTDGDIIKSAIQTVVCLPSDEAKYYRAPSAGSSDSKVKVYHLRPAPGQFIAQISGQTEEEACRYAETRMNVQNNYVSLGAWGGYIIVGFDHSVYNKPDVSSNGGYDFSIIGNPFDGSSEPGIVYVMQDENGDGLPNDTWYELRGSETGKTETYQHYAVTYYRPPTHNMPLQWIDNRGNSGSIDLNPNFPLWIKENNYTLYGTRLKRNTTRTPGGIWRNESYPWGYADNWGEDILADGDNHDAAPVGNTFKIENAMYPDGTPVKLQYIDFIKVQTGIQSVAGAIGELSTEVFGFVDYKMSEAPSKID